MSYPEVRSFASDSPLDLADLGAIAWRRKWTGLLLFALVFGSTLALRGLSSKVAVVALVRVAGGIDENRAVALVPAELLKDLAVQAFAPQVQATETPADAAILDDLKVEPGSLGRLVRLSVTVRKERAETAERLLMAVGERIVAYQQPTFDEALAAARLEKEVAEVRLASLQRAEAALLSGQEEGAAPTLDAGMLISMREAIEASVRGAAFRLSLLQAPGLIEIPSRAEPTGLLRPVNVLISLVGGIGAAVFGVSFAELAARTRRRLAEAPRAA
ncbi:MAG: hypothetical protein KDA22_13880 [Phycisphaerales bacterium]|nr:hypothetical protein [Phycisphaerales bacterium]